MSETSEVLARKYRPNNFQELIAQDSITQTLSLALDTKRLSHAYLFSGLRGSGKTSTARIFSKALVCDNGPTSKPCEICPNCKMAAEGRHMDIIEMDAASSRKIDDIRDLIEHTKYKPASAKYKVFIIDEVHMLTKEAFNALLKTLEEPPEYVKFILATTDPLKLPATILSRTQHFRFKKIPNNSVVQHLIHILNLENIKFENEALEILARSGAGSLRDTLTLLDQAIIYSKNFVDVNTVTDMLGLVDPKFIENVFSAIFAKDRAKLIEYVQFLCDYESEMVIDELIAYLKERLFTNDPQYSTLVLERFFRILSDSKSLFAINADGSFVLSLVFFKMLEALRVKEIDQMIESLENEIKRPANIHINPQTEQKQETEPTIQKQEVIQEPQEVQKIIQEETIPPQNSMFKTLQDKIMDRNAQLGQCFNEHISYISFEDDILIWESCADEECKKQLRNGYGVIKQFVREIFGFDTKIKAQPCSKTEEKKNPEILEYEEPPQSASMTEDIETGSGSCVSYCNENDESTKELDANTILDEPFVKKAAQLFEATKITVQSKI